MVALQALSMADTVMNDSIPVLDKIDIVRGYQFHSQEIKLYLFLNALWCKEVI